MERLVICASRRHIYRKLVFWLILLAVGFGLLTAGLVRWLGWGLVLVSGAYALFLLRALGEETERVVIDDSGIRDSALPVGTIGPVPAD